MPGAADRGRVATAAELLDRLARLADAHPSAVAGDAHREDTAADQWWRGSVAQPADARQSEGSPESGASAGEPDAGPAGRDKDAESAAGLDRDGIAAFEEAAVTATGPPADTATFLAGDRQPYRPWFAGDGGLDPWFAS